MTEKSWKALRNIRKGGENVALTADGYARPTFDEILESQIERAKTLFGNDIETSEQTPLGKFIRLNVYDIAELYEHNEKVYYARFPNTAEGTSLDRLMPFAAITRNPPTPARHIVTIEGEPGTTVEIGFLVDTNDAITFYLMNEAVIGDDGTVDGLFEAEVAGTTGNVALGDIVNIVNPTVGIESITHKQIDTIARDVESDVELRERFDLAIAGAGSGTINSIRGEIMRIQNVYGCIVEENASEEVDEDGRPPHTFQCYVLADESLNQEIAEAIFRKKPVGIKSYGDIKMTVRDKGGFDHEVYFSKTTEQVVSIKLRIVVNNLFEETGTAQIVGNLVKKINKLANGEGVVLSSLYSEIHAVEGVVDVKSLLLSVDGGEYLAQNVVCEPDQAVRTSASAIEVEVVSG